MLRQRRRGRGTVAAIPFPLQRYALAVLATPSATDLLEVTYDADGGASAIQHALVGAFQEDQWVILTLDAKLSSTGLLADTFSASLGSDPGGKDQKHHGCAD